MLREKCLRSEEKMSSVLDILGGRCMQNLLFGIASEL